RVQVDRLVDALEHLVGGERLPGRVGRLRRQPGQLDRRADLQAVEAGDAELAGREGEQVNSQRRDTGGGLAEDAGRVVPRVHQVVSAVDVRGACGVGERGDLRRGDRPAVRDIGPVVGLGRRVRHRVAAWDVSGREARLRVQVLVVALE